MKTAVVVLMCAGAALSFGATCYMHPKAVLATVGACVVFCALLKFAEKVGWA